MVSSNCSIGLCTQGAAAGQHLQLAFCPPAQLTPAGQAVHSDCPPELTKPLAQAAVSPPVQKYPERQYAQSPAASTEYFSGQRQSAALSGATNTPSNLCSGTAIRNSGTAAKDNDEICWHAAAKRV